MESRTMIGVTLAMMGTFVTALGNHFVFKSHSSVAKKQNLSRIYFLLGNLCIVVLGTSLGITAFAFAPQSLVAPLGGLTIVWNLILAMIPFFGGVRPQSSEIVATVLTLLGTILIVWLGPQNRQVPNTFGLFIKPSFVTLIALYGAIGVIFDRQLKSQNKFLRRIAAGSSGGVVGGLSNVFAKCAVDFHSGKHVSSEASDFGTFYLVVALALCLALLQLTLFNNALANFPVVQVVPIYQTTLIIAATISGGVAFDEFSEFSLVQFVGFSCGILTSIFGVAVLAASPTTVMEETKD